MKFIKNNICSKKYPKAWILKLSFEYRRIAELVKNSTYLPTCEKYGYFILREFFIVFMCITGACENYQ